MAVKVLELHHHGIRIGPTPEQLSKASLPSTATYWD